MSAAKYYDFISRLISENHFSNFREDSVGIVEHQAVTAQLEELPKMKHKHTCSNIRAAIYVQQYANISAVRRENAAKFSVKEYEKTIKRRKCQSDTIIALPKANNGDHLSGETLMKKFNQKSQCRK